MKKWDENQSIFNFLLHVRGTSQHFLRSNHLEMCYFFVYLHIYETQLHSCLGTAIPGILHPKFWKFCDRHIFSLFLTKTKLFLLHCFGMGLLPSRCWIFLFGQLMTLLLLCLNDVKLWHQKMWIPLKVSAFQRS